MSSIRINHLLILIMIGSCSQEAAPQGSRTTTSSSQSSDIKRKDEKKSGIYQVSTNGVSSFPREIIVPGGPKSYIGAIVNYGAGPQGALQGIYLRPDGLLQTGPAILALSDEYGADASFQSMLLPFVAMGYRVLIPHIVNPLPTSPEEAKRAAATIEQRGEADLLSNIDQAHSHLISQLGAQGVILMGWGIGGKWAFILSTSLPQKPMLAISFYGNPFGLIERKHLIRTPLLGFFASDDPGIDPSEVQKLGQELLQLNLQAAFKIYGQSKPGFAEAAKPLAYNKALADKAFAEAKGFIGAYLQKP